MRHGSGLEAESCETRCDVAKTKVRRKTKVHWNGSGLMRSHGFVC